jgi:DNA-binding transcriptional regulator YhcF (GntR family)
MTDSGVGDDINMSDDQRKNKRLQLVAQLRDAGYTSAKSISDELIERKYGYLKVSPETISRDLRRLREKGRDFIENVVLNGEFIIEHHEALEEFKRIKNRASEEIPQSKKLHAERANEIDAITSIDEGEKMKLKLQNDALYNTSKLNNNRLSMQATKEFTQLFNKTETVWGLKKFIKENNPKAFEKPELQTIINNLEEKGED